MLNVMVQTRTNQQEQGHDMGRSLSGGYVRTAGSSLPRSANTASSTS